MPTRQEQSAGVVVFRIGPNVIERQFLLLDYGHHWDYPKGHLEPGENAVAAALRELAEETGIVDIRLLDGFRQDIHYTFRDRRKGLIRKTVSMFLGQTQIDHATISHEHVGWAFLPYEQALDRLTYPNAKVVLTAANAFLNARPTVE